MIRDARVASESDFLAYLPGGMSAIAQANAEQMLLNTAGCAGPATFALPRVDGNVL